MEENRPILISNTTNKFDKLLEMEYLQKTCPKETFESADKININQADLSQYKALVSTTPDYELFGRYRQASSSGIIILLTDLPMAVYSKDLKNEEHTMVDHLVSTYERSDHLLEDLRITINKLSDCNIFGIDHYLKPIEQVHTRIVNDSSMRSEIKAEIIDFLKSQKIPKVTIRNARSIAEEFLLNILYDAPHAGGLPSHTDIDQSCRVTLGEKHQGSISFCCNEEMVCIAVSDPFGKLAKATFFKYIKKALMTSDHDEFVDTKKIGAGLGLYKVLMLSHAIICNSHPNKKTEMIALLNYKEPLRSLTQTPRSIHFFQQQ